MKTTAKAGIERVLDEMEKWADDEEENGLYDCRNLGTDAVRGWATVIREHLAKGAAVMSVPQCRNCRHFKDGKCLSEKRRALYRADGSVFLMAPATMWGNDGCDWAFEEKEREENGNG